MTTPNVDLLRATMDAVLAHPDLHEQKAWAVKRSCGTAMCFAGWACVLEGMELDALELANWLTTSITDEGEHIGDAATRLLGLDPATADALFASDNSTIDLKHYVDEICEHGLIRSAQDPWVQE